MYVSKDILSFCDWSILIGDCFLPVLHTSHPSISPQCFGSNPICSDSYTQVLALTHVTRRLNTITRDAGVKEVVILIALKI